MNRNIFAAFVLVGLLGASASATPMTFQGALSGAKEEPANGSAGVGNATVTIDSDTHQMIVDVTFSGLTSNNTAAHIHVINGPGDANTADTVGPVTTTTPTFIGFPSNVTSGTFHAVYDMTQSANYRAGFITDAGGTTALAEAALFSGITSGRAYLNIHTVNNGGGEIRSFLTPVPEPSAFALGGFAVFGAATMRRRLRNRID